MYYNWSGLKAIHTLITITQTESTLDPLPITIYGRFVVYLVPFSSDSATTTRFLRKTAKKSNAVVKTKYFVHQIDMVNPAFAVHPEWSPEATGLKSLISQESSSHSKKAAVMLKL